MFFKGKIKKIFAYKESSAWTSGVVYLDTNEEKRFCGIVPGAAEGMILNGEGEIEVQPKYGEQIKLSSAFITFPETKEGIIKILMTYNGIGEGIANRIYDIFGDKSVKILKQEPEKLIKVSGITERKIEKIKETEGINIFVQNLIKEIPVLTINQAQKIAVKFGNKSVSKVKEDPYILIKSFKGIGFKKADEIAKNLGFTLTCSERIRAAMIYILHEQHDKNGHMYLTASTLQSEVLKLVSDFSFMRFASAKQQNKFERLMTEDIQEYIENKDLYNQELGLVKEEIDFVNKWVEIVDEIVDKMVNIINEAETDEEIYVDENSNIYYKVDYDTENYTSNVIAILSKLKSIKPLTESYIIKRIEDEEKEQGYSLGEEQKKAIITSLLSRISIITGGPGRGKTTIINYILNIWDDFDNVILCAPTGRAAQRMKEQTGHPASTIHSLIYNNYKIDNSLFVVDESSMIDILLASKLMHLVMSGENNIIFVGDADQLPSIGAGNFFNDLILSKVIPTTFLRKGYRNTGNIADNAAKINAGNGFSKMGFGTDFTFFECEHEVMQNRILEDYGKFLEKYEPSDICILSPMRTRSSSGTEKLNELIRKKYNKNFGKEIYKNYKFIPDDRVMCIKNNARKELLNGDTGIFNGDCGTVIKVNKDENLTLILFDDGKEGWFDNSELNEFVLSYAITIHKSQGSEYKIVILTLTTEHYVMLQRNLLYTAITRAKEHVDFLGMKKAFNMAIRNTDYKLRNSKFRTFILTMANFISKKDKKAIDELRRFYEEKYSEIQVKKSKYYYEDDE